VVMAGVSPLGDLASAIGLRAQETAIVAELKAGSEDAYAWLVDNYHQPVYNVVYRMLNDPADAADTTQEIFLKVFRGIRHFHGESSLKTWIYRIAIHEASNHRRWWFRHKAQETPMEGLERHDENGSEIILGPQDTLVDKGDSPFDALAHAEIRARVEKELKEVPEPYRTSLILRDLEEMSYEEIADITQVSLGTVKSRLTRGREILKRRLATYIQEVGSHLGLSTERKVRPRSTGGAEVEVAS
jgi:RNA polymerase sigma-70 factor, ECF subfamily